MAHKTVTGIDVGTYQIKVVVATQDQSEQRVRIIGTGQSYSRGIRHGYITNKHELTKALATAIEQAERSSGTSIKRAYVSVGGIGLEEFRSRAELTITRADGVVSDVDVKNVLEESEHKIGTRLVNRKIIHAIPLSYRVDGERVLGRPLGLKGTKLEVESLFITTLDQHLSELFGAVEEVGVSVVDVMASPIAGSFVTLSKAQKIAGVVLANIGAETVSIAVFENDVPISVRVFPVGSTNITHDIALGLRISLDDAEQAKRGTLIDVTTSKKRLDDIIVGRVSDMLALVEAHLKRIGKSGLLPAGVVISGGGSGVTTIEDVAKAVLKLPSRRATLMVPDSSKVKDSTWAVAYGLCLWGITNSSESSNLTALRSNAQRFIEWCRQLLP